MSDFFEEPDSGEELIDEEGRNPTQQAIDENDDAGSHEAGPIDEVLREEVEETQLQRVLVGIGEVDQGIEEVGPGINEGK